MKRAVICVTRPWEHISAWEKDYSIMAVNPNDHPTKLNHLISESDYSLLIKDDGIIERQGGDYGDEKILWYTSGTTGLPKLYSFSQTQLSRKLRTVQSAYQITANDRYVGCMPLWHGHGQLFYFLAQAVGFESYFGTIKDIKLMEQVQPTFITSIPDLMPVFMKLDLTHLRFARTASSALPDHMYQKMCEKWRCPVIEAFGMTEALSQCFSNPLHGPQRPGTVGLAQDIEVVLKGKHLWIKGPCTVNQDWVDTGDLAEQDDHGYYRILGRYRDQIKIRGIAINPLILENALLNHFSDITECVIFGTDQLKCLYIGDVTPNQVTSFLKTFGTHCRPTLCQAVEQIPKNTNGKISRPHLCDLYA